MIIKGSMNYDQHGRRRKRKVRFSGNRKKVKPSGWSVTKRKEYADNKKRKQQYKSAPIGEYKVPKDNSYKKEISKQYTVAIAYNKGAYQVIPNSDVEHIGK